MKHLLSAGAILLSFSLFVLSFCTLRFWVIDVDGVAPFTFYYQEALPIDKIHVSISAEALDRLNIAWDIFMQSAHALPFYAVDCAEVLCNEAAAFLGQCNKLLVSVQKDGSTFI